MDKHTTMIVSDTPVSVVVPDDARWFRVFVSLVESGAWSRLSDTACRVYVVLAKHCGPQWVAWPSLPTLSRLAGKSRAQVKRAMLELISEGLMRRRSGGGRQSTLYQLFDTPQSPSLPFPVREKTGGSCMSPQQGHGRARSRVMGEPRTRPIEQDSLNSKQAAAVEALGGLGVSSLVARAAVEKFGPDNVVSVVKGVKQRVGVRNPAGLCLALLERGEVPAVKKTASDEAAAMSEMRRRQQLADEKGAEAIRAKLFKGGSTGRSGS